MLVFFILFPIGKNTIEITAEYEYISSAEAGVNKPDLQIFKLALAKANCVPEETYMIGDRLDNDIEPAVEIGMNTIWVKQGSFAYGSVELAKHKPDHTVNSIIDILQFFV